MENKIVEINVQGIGEGQEEGREAQEIKEIKTGPVTLEDIREVVDDPFATNASRVREVLGRGSNATIQKHLQTLREELQREREIKTGDAPEAPEVMVQSIWISAWNAAVAQVRTRMEQIVAERDHYKSSFDANRADAEALAEDLDEARTLAEQEAQARSEAEKQAADALAQAQAEAKTEKDAMAEQLAQVQADAEKKAQAADATIKDLQHQSEINQLKWEAERQTIIGMNESLNDKLRVAETERDKILSRIEKIQADADNRVAKIEADAKAEIAKAQEEARVKIVDVEAKAKDGIASLRAEQEKASKAKK